MADLYGDGLYGADTYGGTLRSEGYGSGLYGAGAYGGAVDSSGSNPFGRRAQPYRKTHPSQRPARVTDDDEAAIALVLTLL